MAKLLSLTTGVSFAALIVSSALADGPDISAQRLLESWKDDYPGMRMVAEVIASAFASGFYGAGHRGKAGVSRPTRPQRAQIMHAFEMFLGYSDDG